MENAIWTIFLNVLSSLLFACLVWLFTRRRSVPEQATPRAASTEGREQLPNNRRDLNRQKAEESVFKFVFYFVTFALLYMSITMPPVFKALLSNTEVYFSDARFIGHILPAVPITKGYLQLAFFVIAALIYIPLLTFSNFVASLLRPAIDSFITVTARIHQAVVMLVFFLFSIPISATSIWLFYQKTYLQSLMSVAFILLLAFVFSQAQRRT